jgi:hypothetical protein
MLRLENVEGSILEYESVEIRGSVVFGLFGDAAALAGN